MRERKRKEEERRAEKIDEREKASLKDRVRYCLLGILIVVPYLKQVNSEVISPSPPIRHSADSFTSASTRPRLYLPSSKSLWMRLLEVQIQ
jgi:hypothetical protein